MWGGDRFRPHSRPPPIIAHWILSISHPLVYDSDDELLSAGNSTYAYDADGDRTSETVNGVTTTFGYDYDNQLVSITTGSNVVGYAYDALGRRVCRTAGGVTTSSFYDSDRVIP